MEKGSNLQIGFPFIKFNLLSRLIKSDEICIFISIHISELHDMNVSTIPLKFFSFLWLSHHDDQVSIR